MKLRALITTAITAIAVAAPIAQAQTLGLTDSGGPATPAATVRPDDRAGIRGTGVVEPVSVAAPASSGFDWRYTGVGAGAMLLIVAASYGAVRLTGLTRDAHRSLRTS